MKIIRLLINNLHSTSFNYDARETEIIQGVETYVSLETVGKNSAVFVAHLSKVLWYIYIDEIPEFLSRKHDIFTTRGERSTYVFARADKNDVMVTRFNKLAVLPFTKGSFLYYEHQIWFNLKFRGKINFVIIFYVKIKGSCPRAELPTGVMCIRCSLYIF